MTDLHGTFQHYVFYIAVFRVFSGLSSILCTLDIQNYGSFEALLAGKRVLRLSACWSMPHAGPAYAHVYFLNEMHRHRTSEQPETKQAWVASDQQSKHRPQAHENSRIHIMQWSR